MSDLVNTLTDQTGISSDLVHKGLGAILSFLKKELGDETFNRLESSIPGATGLIQKFESSPGAGSGGLLEAITGLAGKLLGGKAADGAGLLAVLSKVGFNPEQIEAFLPKALELIKSHLPPDLLAKVLSSLPALAKLATAGQNKTE
jgi:Protein of unknown function VcgC/VcgE (DUF2780)